MGERATWRREDDGKIRLEVELRAREVDVPTQTEGPRAKALTLGRTT